MGVIALSLVGPTASGKSAVALEMARRDRTLELVSVDSMQVYRGMDIGTAKPSAAERAAVPHHLIDIRDPLHAYSAAEFAADALRLVREINGRGKPALLAGGTLLYFKALFDGLDPMPPADPAVRQQLETQAAQRGWPALHAELAQVDSVTAARLAPNDAQRIQRALEVFRLSGRPWSEFHSRANRAESVWSQLPLLSLEPQNRAWLHERIAQRFDAMLAAGFLDEVKALRARGDLSAGLPSMRCVGYRQAWEMLDGQRRGEPFPLAQLRDKGVFATRQLAKRQLTWLRSMPRREVIACDAPDALAQVLRRARELL
jgi:tRNA dimethylallyltransferase